MYIFTYKNVKISLSHARERISLKRDDASKNLNEQI